MENSNFSRSESNFSGSSPARRPIDIKKLKEI